MGRRLSQKDMSAARHAQETFNSMLKRGEIRDPEKIAKEHIVVCGCGAEGCLFHYSQRNETEEERSKSIAEYNRKMGYDVDAISDYDV